MNWEKEKRRKSLSACQLVVFVVGAWSRGGSVINPVCVRQSLPKRPYKRMMLVSNNSFTTPPHRPSVPLTQLLPSLQKPSPETDPRSNGLLLEQQQWSSTRQTLPRRLLRQPPRHCAETSGCCSAAGRVLRRRPGVVPALRWVGGTCLFQSVFGGVVVGSGTRDAVL
jgi:hypothetical protein